jgi:hypothetical protein
MVTFGGEFQEQETSTLAFVYAGLLGFRAGFRLVRIAGLEPARMRLFTQ